MNNRRFLYFIVSTSLIAVVALSCFSIFFLSPSFTNLIVHNAESEAVKVGQYLSESFRDTGKVTRDLPPGFAATAGRALTDFGLMKIKVFAPDGETVYSSAAEDIGTMNDRDYFHNIVARGGVFSREVYKDRKSLEDQALSQDVVETYVPIMEDGGFLGAFEIYFDITANKKNLDNLLFKSNALLLLIAAGLLLALLVISFIARRSFMKQERAEKEIIQQNLNLLEKNSEQLMFNEELNLILKLVPAIICTAGTDGYFKRVNPAMEKTLGFSSEELLSRPISDFIHPEDNKPVKTESTVKIGGRRTRSFQNRYLCKDGSYRLLEWHTTSAVYGILYAMGRDITEQKLAEQTIEAKNRELYLKNQELELTATAEHQTRREAEILLQAFEAFTTKLDLDEIVAHLVKFIENLVPHDRSAICFSDGKACHLHSAWGASQKHKDVGEVVALPVLLGKIMQARSPILISDTHNDIIAGEYGISAGVETWLAVPMSAHGRNIGYLTLESRQKDAFNASSIRLVQALVNDAAIAFENARLYQEVEKLSTVDSLTGLNNRRHFNAKAQLEFLRALRYDLPLSTIMMDIDHFKQVNDSYGHAVGDTVLIDVAAVCKKGLRSMDQLARYGGEEFCFLLPETAIDGALNLAERLRADVAGLQFDSDEGPFSITASFGVAERQTGNDSIDDLLKRSDLALYDAKKEGRNRVTMWTFT